MNVDSTTKSNNYLNRYYSSEVTLRQNDIDKSGGFIMPIIEKILQHVNKQDRRFSAQPEKVGSYWQGLKVDKADEFDISVPLCWLTNPGQLSLKNRYYDFENATSGAANEPQETMSDDFNIVRTKEKLADPPKGYGYLSFKQRPNIWRESEGKPLFIDDDLVPFLVKRRFKQLLLAARKELKLKGKVHMLRKVNGPALTISVDVPKQHPISVDFAPMYQAHMPFPDYVTWPHRDAKWPSSDKIDAIKEIGMNFVAKHDFYWLMSFAEAEKELVKEMDADDGCRKKCHRIMKKLLGDVWCPAKEPVIKSYHLKNVLFWECEKYPTIKDWQGDKLATRFYSMLTELESSICHSRLPQYFYAKVNLLENKNTEELAQVLTNIKKFRQNPKKYLVQEE